MNRAINSMGFRGRQQNVTGYKMGDFGTGGRVYKSTQRRQRGDSSCGVAGPCIAVLLICASLYYAYDTEKSLNLSMGVLAEALATAKTLYDARVVASLNQQLIHINSNNAQLTGPSFHDSFFGTEFPSDAATARRMTDYCQWEEIQHRDERVIGQEPDTCAFAGTGKPQCNGITCRLGQCNSPCCSLRKGADIVEVTYSYSYVKGWRRQQINSLMFDNPAAYHNPSRDPAPAEQFWTQGEIDLAPGADDGLHVQAADLDEAGGLMDWQPMYLSKQHVHSVSSHALNAGFGEADHLYFYSRVAQDGLNNPFVRAAASYLVDGVVDISQISNALGVEAMLGNAGLDWITKGTCNAGDIRVSFEVKTVPQKVSVVGAQVRNYVAPHRYANGQTRIIAKPGIWGLDELVGKQLDDAIFSSRLQRLGVCVASFAGCLLYFEGIDAHVIGVYLSSLGLVFTLLWWLYYEADLTFGFPIAASAVGVYLLQQSNAPPIKEA